MKSRQSNPMQATWSKAALVRRSLKAGRQRKVDEPMEPESAVMACRMALIQFRRAMVGAGIFPTLNGDVFGKIGLALVTKPSAGDAVTILSVPWDVASYPALVSKAEELADPDKGNFQPLGILYWQLDTEQPNEDQRVQVWMQPWLVKPRSQQAAKEAVRAFRAADGESVEYSDFEYSDSE